MIFAHQRTIYRDFDIRGLYPEEITDDEVYKIGHALAKRFTPKVVVIGYDIRPSADALFAALARGLTEAGVTVINLGLCTTPMTYFMASRADIDMTVMITASHMPSQYNGLKITIEDAKPLSADILKELRTIVGEHTYSSEGTRGTITNHALQTDWIARFKAAHNLAGANLKVVIDPANMIGILEIDTFKAFEPDLTVHTIFDTYDHTCPNHEANPIKTEALKSLAEAVVKENADIGVAFDGDADRVGLVDETGQPVPSDIVGALIARRVLAEYPGSTIVCDIRTSRCVTEEIERLGGRVVREKVGHTNMRARMRQEDAVLGIELSGHFFFKSANYSEGGALPAFVILELLKATKQPLSALVQLVKRYAQSGEINSRVTRTPDEIYQAIMAKFPDLETNRLDGLTLISKTWWCNVRPSANDPVMRLNLEAETESEMIELRDQLLTIIRV